MRGSGLLRARRGGASDSPATAVKDPPRSVSGPPIYPARSALARRERSTAPGERTCSMTMIARADHAGAVAELAGHDAQVARRERQRAAGRPPRARPASSCSWRVGDVAADHDHRGLKKLTAPASTSPSVRPASRTIRIAPAWSPSARAARRRGSCDVPRPAAARRSGQRVAAGDRLEAADVAAAADDVVARRSPRMWPMSPAAPSAPRWMWPSATIPQPMPVPDLDEEQVLRLAPAHPSARRRAMMFTSLSTSTGRPVAPGEPLRDGEVVPAGHDRRVDRPAAVELDRARHADADPAHVDARAADLVEQLVEAARRPSRAPPPGPRRCPRSMRRSASGVAGEVGHGHPRSAWRRGRRRGRRRRRG